MARFQVGKWDQSDQIVIRLGFLYRGSLAKKSGTVGQQRIAGGVGGDGGREKEERERWWWKLRSEASRVTDGEGGD